ncbi:putative uncharacterized protein DDB_G0282499 [Helicoverpa armigera]|uniref:putative uncharacterized protein DDB_G0282499 n=1 Tax=Helicoverpa armigera TaxID=29058 RepID=UPI003082A72F
MATYVQILLPLLCVVLSEAQLIHHSYFNNPGLHHQEQPYNNVRNQHHNAWFHHFVETDEPPYHSGSNERDDDYGHFDPFFQKDPFFYGNAWGHIGMPEISNTYNGPNGGYNSHRHEPSHVSSEEKRPEDHNDSNREKPEEKPEEKPKDLPLVDKPEDKVNEKKIKEEIKNNPEILPPKTNEIKKKDENKDKKEKPLDLDKKKDYLLVGQGNNGNNLFLLHENVPNPSTVIIPNGNHAGSNVIYVPLNPGQTNNPVYQLVSGQTAPAGSTNVPITQDKLGVNGYNNGVQNPAQSTGDYAASVYQNPTPNYVTIYSNGQLIQIPGVVVNQPANNAPVQNGNTQGTSYVVANTVPNNMQNVQNPNVIYAAIPNQGSTGPIYVQMPNCMSGCSETAQNPVQGVNNGANFVPNNVVYQLNPTSQVGVSNNYAQQMVAPPPQGSIAVTIPNQGVALSNQNVPSPTYQTVTLPVNSGSNGYNQPIVMNQVQVPNQGVVSNIQPAQTGVQMPVPDGSNSYNQPAASNQRQETNAPNQGVLSNQNNPLQAVEVPNNNAYNQPIETNASPVMNVESRDEVPNGQNGQAQPQIPNQVDQGTNVVSNLGEVVQPENAQPMIPPTSIILDSSNLSALGAQPAIMISGFKDKGKKESKKDKNDSAEKKDKKDKSKKKYKKPKDEEKVKDGDKPKDAKPFTNKKKR